MGAVRVRDVSRLVKCWQAARSSPGCSDRDSAISQDLHSTCQASERQDVAEKPGGGISLEFF